MLREVLSIGDKIDVKRLDRMGKPLNKVRTFVSQLADFVDNDVIYIAAPIRSGITIIPEAGDSYNLCFYTKHGLYQCSCTIIRIIKDNNIVLVEVKVTSDLEKFQRRQYYRLECIYEIKYHPISYDEELLANKIKEDDFMSDTYREECKKRLEEMQAVWLNASITDISGGGTKFTSSHMHKEGDKLRINLDIEVARKHTKMNLGAVIISSSKLFNRYGVYENRAEFTDISKKDREELIRFVFEQERRLRKNDHKQ